MNPNFIPGVIDAVGHMEDAVTKTGNYNGASLFLGKGFNPGGIGQPMAAIPNISVIDISSGDETYAFTLQESADNSTFTACGPTVTLTAVALAKPLAYSVPGFVSQPYIRLALVVGGTTPSATYTTESVVIGVNA